MNQLKDRIAIITGAASGIGRAAAKLFAQRGATVVLADINDAEGKQAADEIVAAEGDAVFVPTDVTVESDIERLVEEIVKRFGRLDIMYNNAGYEEYHMLHEIPSDSWSRQIAINLNGTFLGCKYALQHFIKRKAGVILNTSSISGVLPTPDRPAYNSAKGGVIMLTKNIALEYGKYGIRANVICPGTIVTKMTAPGLAKTNYEEVARRCSVLGRIGEAEEVAKAALFLVSDDASYITGSVLHVDGGMGLGGYWR